MQDDEGSCTQMAKIGTQCETLLNPLTYTTQLKYYLGIGGPENEAKKVKLEQMYRMKNGVYTSATGTLGSTLTSSGG